MYRLLIVEDEEFLRKSLCVMIDWQGLGIQVAGAVETVEKRFVFSRSRGWSGRWTLSSPISACP